MKGNHIEVGGETENDISIKFLRSATRADFRNWWLRLSRGTVKPSNHTSPEYDMIGVNDGTMLKYSPCVCLEARSSTRAHIALGIVRCLRNLNIIHI